MELYVREFKKVYDNIRLELTKKRKDLKKDEVVDSISKGK